MKDAVPVRVLERVGDRRAELEPASSGSGPVASRDSSVPPGTNSMTRKSYPVLGIEVEHGGDPGMGQPGERQGLEPESLTRRRVVRVRRAGAS